VGPYDTYYYLWLGGAEVPTFGNMCILCGQYGTSHYHRGEQLLCVSFELKFKRMRQGGMGSRK